MRPLKSSHINGLITLNMNGSNGIDFDYWLRSALVYPSTVKMEIISIVQVSSQ
jgi:hypothetical protein